MLILSEKLYVRMYWKVQLIFVYYASQTLLSKIEEELWKSFELKYMASHKLHSSLCLLSMFDYSVALMLKLMFHINVYIVS
jgi:hypothetical protein